MCIRDRFTDAFYRSCTVSAAQAAQDLGIQLSYNQTLRLAERSEQEYGYSMHGYVTEHGISYADLHFPYHKNIDESVIQPLENLSQYLGLLNIPQIILTNASRCWAERVLQFIGIGHIFDSKKIIPMEDVDFEPKSSSEKGFRKAIDLLNLNPANIIMVEDLDRNLITAKKIGLQTAYIYYKNPIKNLPSYIDYQYKDSLHLIKDLFSRA